MPGARNFDEIAVITLGLSPVIGKSCYLVIFGRHISFILDCGLKTGSHSGLQYPVFDNAILKDMDYDIERDLDFLLLSHAHFDHSGSIPFFLNRFPGYKNPIYCTEATKGLLPYMFADYERVIQGFETKKRGYTALKYDFRYTNDYVDYCIDKIQTVGINESFHPGGNESVTVTFSNAGHLLGAVITTISLQEPRPAAAAGAQAAPPPRTLAKLVYTGDFNTTTRVILPGAVFPEVARNPDIFICETTYCNISKRPSIYRDALQHAEIAEVVRKGGCVLLPTNSTGSAQDIAVRMSEVWTRFRLPCNRLYITHGIVNQMSECHAVMGSYALDTLPCTAPPVRISALQYSSSILHDTKSNTSRSWCLISAPNQIKSGVTLDAFSAICDRKDSLVCLPGHAPLAGYNWRLVNGLVSRFASDNMNHDKSVQVTIKHLAFNAHVDFQGICTILDYLCPKAVMFIHNTAVDNVRSLSENLQQYYAGSKVVFVGNNESPLFKMPMLRGSCSAVESAPREAAPEEGESEPSPKTTAATFDGGSAPTILRTVLPRLTLVRLRQLLFRQGLVLEKIGSETFKAGPFYFQVRPDAVACQWPGPRELLRPLADAVRDELPGQA